MATSDLQRKAKEAFIDDHFELAIDLYSQAISLNPNDAELFADRSQANFKLCNFTGKCENFTVFKCLCVAADFRKLFVCWSTPIFMKIVMCLALDGLVEDNLNLIMYPLCKLVLLEIFFNGKGN